MKRKNDIEPIQGEKVSMEVDGTTVEAAKGETVLTTLFAMGKRDISKNDRGEITGAYCGMGVCYSCTLTIDKNEKQRACQTVVESGMKVKTASNRFDLEGWING